MDSGSSDVAVIDQVTVTTHAPQSRRGFWALIATQFQGAFSDNILRNLLLSMIVGMNLAKAERETFVSVITFLFSLPFLFLSMPGGWLADRFSKRPGHDLDQGRNGVRIDAARYGRPGDAHTVAFAGCPHVGCQPGGSLWTVQVRFVAGAPTGKEPVVGQWRNRAGNIYRHHPRYSWRRVDGRALQHTRGVCRDMLLSLSRQLASRPVSGIDKVPPAAPDKTVSASISPAISGRRSEKCVATRALFLAVLGNTYFWFLGSLLFSTMSWSMGPGCAPRRPKAKTGYLNAMLAVGIGIGSMAAGWLSDNKIEYGLIPAWARSVHDVYRPGARPYATRA